MSTSYELVSPEAVRKRSKFVVPRIIAVMILMVLNIINIEMLSAGNALTMVERVRLKTSTRALLLARMRKETSGSPKRKWFATGSQSAQNSLTDGGNDIAYKFTVCSLLWVRSLI